MKDKEKIKAVLEIITQGNKEYSYYVVPEKPSDKLMEYFSSYKSMANFIKSHQELFSIYGIAVSEFGDIFYNEMYIDFRGNGDRW